MQQHESTFRDLGVQIVIVTFESSAHAAAYAAESHLPFPIVIDDARSLYQAYGMERGSRWAIWGPRTWRAYAKELLRGRLPRLADHHSDAAQLGGNILIDPSGVIKLAHVGAGPADRPSIAALLEALRQR